MNNRNPSDPTPLLLAAIVVVALSMRGCNVPDVTPEPPNPPAPVVTVKTTFDSYRRLMAEAWSEGAARLERGELTSDRAAHDWIEGRANLAREAAGKPTHDREQAALGKGKWTAAANAALWRQFATECQ